MVKDEIDKAPKLDNAISVINYILRKKKKRADELSHNVQLSESQKIFLGEEYDLIRNVEILIKYAKKSVSDTLGKLPPQDLDLETAVLGAAIFENPAFEKVKSFLLPEHFHNENHKLIWSAALQAGKNQTFQVEKDNNGSSLKVYENGIDLHKVVVELRTRGQIELVGGAHYLVELTTKVSSSASIDYHARVLIEMAMKRELILISSKMLHDSFDDTGDCFDILEFGENQLKQIKGWIK